MENASKSSEPSEGKPESPQPKEDDDFEPSAEMMIHEFDDESTLNNEEDAENEEDNAAELAELTKESEMPLEELMALYYSGNVAGTDEAEEPEADSEDDTNPEKINSDETLYTKNEGLTRRSLRSSATFGATASDSDSSEENEQPAHHESEWKKPRIGDEYQVTEIPEMRTGEENYAHKEDKQVWQPWSISSDVVEQFLKEVADAPKDGGSASPLHIQDNEDALFILKQADNNPVEALKRFRSRPSPLDNEIQVWSEEECKQFELGLTMYGKDFRIIHLNKVRTKSVRDIIKFYYMWKKSERYDRFTAKTRLGKKKENLHPGVTDYMDRLLDETDSANVAAFNQSHLKYRPIPHSYALIEHLQQMHAAQSYIDNDGPQSSLAPSLEVNCNNNCLDEPISTAHITSAKNEQSETSTESKIVSEKPSLEKSSSSSAHENICRQRPRLWDDSNSFPGIYNNELEIIK